MLWPPYGLLRGHSLCYESHPMSLDVYKRQVWDPKTNLQKRKDAEQGACEDKKRIATRAKALNLDAIHDTVHEMCKDEARHGKGFEGLYNRYFGDK